MSVLVMVPSASIVLVTVPVSAAVMAVPAILVLSMAAADAMSAFAMSLTDRALFNFVGVNVSPEVKVYP
jgi:hypothetical protein